MQQVLVLIPPIIAIALALITKEVYSSLIIGIIVGAFLFVFGGAEFYGHTLAGSEALVTAYPGEFNLLAPIELTYEAIIGSVADSWNAGILVFLVLLGVLVVLITKAGGSKAYGAWASRKIKTKKGALLATSALGALIFVDDYFNCLTVGTVMKPVTDEKKISRAKLAYIIDATAAPICIIAPISSWAAAVTSNASVENPFGVFLQTIPFNFYAILTLIFVVSIVCLNIDFGPMKKAEELAESEGDVGDTKIEQKDPDYPICDKGTVWDLIIPIVTLIVCSVSAMIYIGGGFEVGLFGDTGAFANTDAVLALNLGAIGAIIVTLLLYLPRKVITPKDYMESLIQGFKSMVPAITILALAWTLGSICKNYLLLGDNISVLFENTAILNLVPAIMFLLAAFIGFSTGTSWGTMAILIPLVESLFGVSDGQATTIVVVSIASVLAGAVLGDHISPISDTTIMASTGAQCNHISHVSTQMPYALCVGAICFVSFLVAGLVSGMGYGVALAITWAVSLVAMAGLLFVLKMKTRDKKQDTDETKQA